MNTSGKWLPLLAYRMISGFLAVLLHFPFMVEGPPVLAAQVPAKADSTSLEQHREDAVRGFLEQEVEFDQYLFPPGHFPSVHWKNPERVERLMGAVPLSAKFYDSAYAPVASATRPGRYGAVVSGTTTDGFHIVRYVTLFCCAVDLDDYSPDVPLAVEPLAGFGISPDRWARYRRDQRRFSFGSLLTFPKHDPDAAIFLAGLSELTQADDETPRLRDRQWWTEFKRRLDPVSRRPFRPDRPKLAAPAEPSRQSSDLYSPGEIQRLREICVSWADSVQIPLTVTVLHKGRLAFEGAFGVRKDGSPMTGETQTWMASITKLLTGVLVMQFVDAGIVDLDVSLDHYLPELGSPCPLTLRHLLTHTSSLSWAGEWASDWNPSMENQVAQALPFLRPGREFKYHRVGYALAAKVLERLSGTTVPVLFQELVFDPLGMVRAYADNTYGGLYATANDLSRFGQMLLDHGQWGKIRLLSEGAWAAMLPKPLRFGNLKLQRTWGIGCAPLGGKGLSDSTFGHEAASGALLRIDPAHDLVVVLGRDRTGPDYRQYERFVTRFLRAVSAPWEKPRE